MFKLIAFTLLMVSVIAVPLTDPENDGNKVVQPEYLDMLLREKRYQEFNDILGIPLLSMTDIKNGQVLDNPMFNPDLPHGDMLYGRNQNEEGRQGLRWDTNPNSRWPGRPGIVAYTINRDIPRNVRQTIERAIDDWNRRVRCVKFRPRRNEANFAYFTRGNGCYAFVGRLRGRPQPISIGPGCETIGIIQHEMEHTAGFAHEHNRNDRDNYVRVLWHNIRPEMRSQYERTNPRDYGTQANYDYYSVMHYPYIASGTNRPAFQILRNGVDTRRMGRAPSLRWSDIEKINILYC